MKWVVFQHKRQTETKGKLADPALLEKMAGKCRVVTNRYGADAIYTIARKQQMLNKWIRILLYFQGIVL